MESFSWPASETQLVRFWCLGYHKLTGLESAHENGSFKVNLEVQAALRVSIKLTATGVYVLTLGHISVSVFRLTLRKGLQWAGGAEPNREGGCTGLLGVSASLSPPQVQTDIRSTVPSRHTCQKPRVPSGSIFHIFLLSHTKFPQDGHLF